MLKETVICSLLVATIALGLGLVLGLDGELVMRIMIFVACGPLLYAAYLQHRVLAEHARGKAQRALANSPDVYVTNPWRKLSRAVAALPEPERRRLVPLRSHSPLATAFDMTSPTGEQLRIVPIAPAALIDEADERDLEAFIDGLTVRGHSRRGWLNVKLPSGRVCDTIYHEALITPLVKVGAVIDRAPRRAGKLVLEAEEIKTRLGLVSEAGATGPSGWSGLAGLGTSVSREDLRAIGEGA